MGKNGVLMMMMASNVQALITCSPSLGSLEDSDAQGLPYEIEQAVLEGFGRLFSRLMALRTHGASSSISELEAIQLANSLCYVLESSDFRRLL